MSKLNELIDQLPDTKSESDVVKITLDIRALLNSQDEDKPDDSDDSSGDADSNDDANSDDSGNASGDADSNDDADSDDSGNASGDANSNDDADSGKSQDNQSKSDSSSSKYPNNLDDADTTDCPDMHEQLRQQVDAEADKNAPDDAAELCKLANAVLGDIKEEDVSFIHDNDFTEAFALVNKLTMTFRRAFMDDKRIKRKYIRENGVLEGNRLTDLVTMPDKAALFRNEARATTTSAAVSIIVDASCSMGWSKLHETANATAYAVSKAFDNLKFISHEVRYMLHGGSYVAKRFHDRKSNPSRFSVYPKGGTPTAELVQSAVVSLVGQAERKKLIIVITDGEANCVQSLSNAVSDAQCFGISVKGIGIKCPTPGIDDGVIIENIQELPQTLMQAVKQGVFK
jgi:cobalamin biosynthesis protein CobT